MAEYFEDAAAWLSSTPAAANLPNQTKLEVRPIFPIGGLSSADTRRYRPYRYTACTR